MVEWMLFGLGAALIAAGLFFVLSAHVGIWRFRYALDRMHAAALGDTMGLLLIILGLCVRSGAQWLTLRLLLIVLFWWIASPVSSHLIARLDITVDAEPEAHMQVKLGESVRREVDI